MNGTSLQVTQVVLPTSIKQKFYFTLKSVHSHKIILMHLSQLMSAYITMLKQTVTRVVGGQYSSPIRAYFRTVIALGKVTQYHLLQDKTPLQYLHAKVNQVHTGPFRPFKSVNLFELK